jgi:hypothetical protein
MIGPYATLQAYRTALDTRLKNVAQSQGIDLQRLRRGVAFERLLARLFSEDNPPWLLKGGYALELRLENRARSTLDLDVSVPDPDHLSPSDAAGENASRMPVVYTRLQQTASRDLKDGFDFLISRPREDPIGAPGGGVRCSVIARVGGRTFAQFHLDVGLGDAVIDPPEWIEGRALLSFAGIPQARVALYPLSQQFAEKIHAYTLPRRGRDNTRVKDLVDLVLLVHLGNLELESVKRALRATFETRGTHPLPARLPQPPSDWVEPYAALAQELDLPASTLQEGYAHLAGYWCEWELFTARAADIEKDME